MAQGTKGFDDIRGKEYPPEDERERVARERQRAATTEEQLGKEDEAVQETGSPEGPDLQSREEPEMPDSGGAGSSNDPPQQDVEFEPLVQGTKRLPEALTELRHVRLRTKTPAGQRVRAAVDRIEKTGSTGGDQADADEVEREMAVYFNEAAAPLEMISAPGVRVPGGSPWETEHRRGELRQVDRGGQEAPRGRDEDRMGDDHGSRCCEHPLH